MLTQEFTKKVVYNLFNYLKSFDSSKVMISANVLDSWFNKFIERYQKDPNFVYKTQTDM
jgi:hypothetical protein